MVTIKKANIHSYCDILSIFVRTDQYLAVFNALNKRFILDDDLNENNTYWGSKLPTTK